MGQDELKCMCVLDSFAICTCLCLILCNNVGLFSMECTVQRIMSLVMELTQIKSNVSTLSSYAVLFIMSSTLDI